MISLFFFYDHLYMSFSSFKTEYIYEKQYKQRSTELFVKARLRADKTWLFKEAIILGGRAVLSAPPRGWRVRSLASSSSKFNRSSNLFG